MLVAVAVAQVETTQLAQAVQVAVAMAVQAQMRLAQMVEQTSVVVAVVAETLLLELRAVLVVLA
jgi:hypothetical protein